MRYVYCTLQNLLKVLNFSFSSPVRRRVAEAGQGMSARTGETTGHSTKLANGFA